MRLRLGLRAMVIVVAVAGAAALVLTGCGGGGGAPSTAELLDQLATGQPEQRSEAARALAARLDPQLAVQVAGRARAGGAAAAGRDAFREQLLTLSRQSPGRPVRRVAVVRSLARLGDPASISALVAALLDDRSPRVQEAASDGLLSTGRLPGPALDRLIAALDAPAGGAARAAAIERLVASGGLPVVQRILLRTADAPWARAVVGRVGLPALPFLRERLRNGSPQVKVAAAYGLLELRRQHPTRLRPDVEAIVEAMLPRLGAAPLSDEVRILALVGRPAADRLLAIKRRDYQQLQGVERNVWENADATLAEMWARNPASVAHLLGALGRRDYALIARIDMFFVQVGKPGSEGVLIDALNAAGNSAMALDFLLCGNARLGSAARSWAASHGYTVSISGSGTTSSWGAARTTPD